MLPAAGRWKREEVKEERWSLTGPKLSVRLEGDIRDATGGCTNKAAKFFKLAQPSTTQPFL